MIQAPLEVYRIDMKYIRNLHISKPKKKHEKMRDKIDFKKSLYHNVKDLRKK